MNWLFCNFLFAFLKHICSTSHDRQFPPMKWLTKTLDPSAAPPLLLAKLTTYCGPSGRAVCQAPVDDSVIRCNWD